jgi:hypothetical protein
MKLIGLCLCFLLLGCTSVPPTGVPEWAGSFRNACLPEAIAVTQGLREKNIQAKVLSIHTDNWGHATCAYLYPPGKNRLWVWDSQWQSIPLRAWWNDPTSIARAWMKWRHDETPVKSAYFHEDLEDLVIF